MKNYDRVKLKPAFEEKYGMEPMIGTVRRKTPFGYVAVLWDDGTKGHFTPGAASAQLDIVIGVEALARHDWDCRVPNAEACSKCHVPQTEENYRDACVVRV